MGGTEAARPNRLISSISSTYSKILLNPSYRYLLLLLGAPVNLVVFLFYLVQRKKDDYAAAENRIRSEMLAAGYLEALRTEIMEQQKRKHGFFKQKVNEGQLRQEVDKIVQARFQEVLKERTGKELKLNQQKR